MIKLSKLLEENRSQKISENKFYDILSNECSEFRSVHLNKYPSTFIYRGLSSTNPNPILLVEPRKHIRKSKNTRNYYTEIIDNSPRWSAFPKRSKSIICTTEYYKADIYGYVYIVIPYNNSTFGICPRDDIWNSFSKSILRYIGFDMPISEAMKEIFGVVEIFADGIEYTDTIESIRAASELINKNKDELSRLVYDYGDFSNKIIGFILRYVKNGKTLMDALEDLLDPKFNGFKASTYSDALSHDGEVWTNSDCVLVEFDYFKKLSVWH